MNSISLAATVDSWRHGLWMHCLLRCNTWNNIAVKSRKDSELHDVTFVSEDGLLCPAHKVMLWSQNALPKFIFQNIALPKCPFHPLLHLIVGRKASLRPTFCQLDGEGGSEVESESVVGQGDASSPASSPPPPPPAPAKVVNMGSKYPLLCWSCFNPDTCLSTCRHVRHLQLGEGSTASWEYLSWVGRCHLLSVVFFNALVCDQYHTKYKHTKISTSAV